MGDGARGRNAVVAALLIFVLGAAVGGSVLAIRQGRVATEAASRGREAVRDAPGDVHRERRRVHLARGRDAQRGASEAAQRGLDELLRAMEDARAGARRRPHVDPKVERAPSGHAVDGAAGDGLLVSYHPDGSEFRRGMVRDGLRDGTWSETFDSGARVVTTYRMGVRHGREAAWHPGGLPRFLGEYDNGEMTGTWTAWHGNGNVLSTRRYRAGKLQGIVRTFHENGALAEESTYDDGAEVGVNRGWHPNGTLAWAIAYARGRRNGPADWYDEQGTRVAHGTYLDGELDGAYVTYAEDGTVKSTERWDHGYFVAVKR